MNLFRNRKTGFRILAGYCLVLVLMGVVSALTVFQLSRVSSDFFRLSQEFGESQRLVRNLINELYRLRLAANRYIIQRHQGDLDDYTDSVKNTRELMELADRIFESNYRDLIKKSDLLLTAIRPTLRRLLD